MEIQIFTEDFLSLANYIVIILCQINQKKGKI